MAVRNSATVRFLRVLLALLLGVAAVAPTLGQTPAQPAPPAEAKAAPSDPVGRDSPRGTVLGFMKAATDGDTQRAALFLNTRGISDHLEERVPQLLAVLDRALSPADLDRLSSKPEGNLADSPNPGLEVVGQFRGGDVSRTPSTLPCASGIGSTQARFVR